MKERILVAEDDRAILTGVADLLESEGYEVIPAGNGAEALELFRRNSPDLVLLDVMMPKMSGYDVCRAIRGENAVVPVVMLTAKGQEVDRVVGLELGADDYIVKPFGMAELLARDTGGRGRKPPRLRERASRFRRHDGKQGRCFLFPHSQGERPSPFFRRPGRKSPHQGSSP
jgi:DNA-binding response OmpR family regulator